MGEMIYSDVEKNILYSNQDNYSLSLRINDFTDEKERSKFIKNCEFLIRRSVEYKLWRSYIHDTLLLNYCFFTEESSLETTVDIHHHPISLFSICECVIDKRILNEKEFCTFDIACEVMELHFQNNVGYVLLLSNLHEKFHNGFLSIPMEFVQGNYRYLLNNYPFSEENRKRIESYLNVRKDNVPTLKWKRDEYIGLQSDNVNMASQVYKLRDVQVKDDLVNELISV